MHYKMVNKLLHVEFNHVQKLPETSMTVACNSDCECDPEYVDKKQILKIIINNYINIIMSIYVY